MDADVESQELSKQEILDELFIFYELLSNQLQPALELHETRVKLPLII